jgi:hypothetical protein
MFGDNETAKPSMRYYARCGKRNSRAIPSSDGKCDFAKKCREVYGLLLDRFEISLGQLRFFADGAAPVRAGFFFLAERHERVAQVE